ncbi:MAG: 16S rRNA (guanine(966)-N(2))-methyltransferase RsmD [Propionibacteriaceae bacterium]|jgi:16S rRNA (guanine966-N2)-methyltransferase|nr:16S rRNA (guanine(966)-N(2))-methyltransferase RsmD [Propionibacteriaceae bacterium]
MSRIIAGTAKGATIRTPRRFTTRPTTDRVREAIFNSLANWAGSVDADPTSQLTGISFLDLYAGSGAMGLEAASRNSSPVTCVERDATTASVIRSNAVTLRLDVQVYATQVAQYLNAQVIPFDIIFLDPPYDVTNVDITTCLTTLVRSGWLSDYGIIIVERSSRVTPFSWPSELERQWHKTYGETAVYYGDRGADPMLGENENQIRKEVPDVKL